MDAGLTVVSGLLVLVGLLGIVVPVLPGLLLIWIGVSVWAVFVGDGWSRWLVLGLITMVAVIGVLAKYAWPGRNLKRAGVPNRTLFLGGLLGLVGFFVIPFVGLIVGFVVGVWLGERLRLPKAESAWPSTRHALKAAGLSMLIELGAGLTITVIWVAALVTA